MKKRMCLWLCILLVVCCPVVYAAQVDLDTPCSLTLHYTKEGIPFPGLEVEIFRVADYATDGTYGLAEPFENYPVEIQNVITQTQWQEITQTLVSYIQADGLSPTAVAATDENGTVRFNQQIPGLYLVMGVTGERSGELHQFHPTMIFLPTPQEDGSLCYDMEAKPKPGEVIPRTEYTVVKLWKDNGSANRPDSVVVEILKDGQLWQTVTLGPENNWSHTWKTTDLNAVWTVVERNVTDGYTVTISQQENTFTIVNTAPTPTPERPQTGDTTSLWVYVLTMSLSGMMLLLLGIWGRRKLV